jgi:hypothetical protein
MILVLTDVYHNVVHSCHKAADQNTQFYVKLRKKEMKGFKMTKKSFGIDSLIYSLIFLFSTMVIQIFNPSPAAG